MFDDEKIDLGFNALPGLVSEIKFTPNLPMAQLTYLPSIFSQVNDIKILREHSLKLDLLHPYLLVQHLKSVANKI